MQVRLGYVLECEQITAKCFVALNHCKVFLLLVFIVFFYCFFSTADKNHKQCLKALLIGVQYEPEAATRHIFIGDWCIMHNMLEE